MTVIPPEPDEPSEDPLADPDDVPEVPQDPDLPGTEPPLLSADDDLEPSASPADRGDQLQDAWPDEDDDVALVPDSERIVPNPTEP